MLALSAATKVYLAAGAMDLRKGFDGLCALVEGVLEEAPLSGHVFLFANAPRTRLKVLVWDGSGLWCPATIGDSVTVLPGGGAAIRAPSAGGSIPAGPAGGFRFPGIPPHR